MSLWVVLESKVEHHWQEEFSGTSQKVEILPDSRVSKLFDRSWVNSFHQQSVKELAPSLIATAVTRVMGQSKPMRAKMAHRF